MAEACSNPQEGCKYVGTPECILTEHHLYYPSPDYTTELEVAFRGLSVNRQYNVPRCEHDEIHATQEPPEKPSIVHMARTLIENQGDYTSKKKKRLIQKLIRRETENGTQ